MNMTVKEDTKINTPRDIYNLLFATLQMEDEIDRQREHFWVILMDARNAVLALDLVSLGTINSSLVHPREVFRRAVSLGCCAIAIGHNHPTGNLEPSAEDLATTTRLVKAGEILGIKLLDHIILGKKNGYPDYKSIKEETVGII